MNLTMLNHLDVYQHDKFKAKKESVVGRLIGRKG